CVARPNAKARRNGFAAQCNAAIIGRVQRLPEPLETLSASRVRSIPPLKTKPIRTVLMWQIIATAAIAAIAGIWVGRHGAISALLGGVINVVAGAVYALILGIGASRRGDAGTALVRMFRAEGAKILAIIALLWVVLSHYNELVPLAFFGTFVVTVFVFSMAI